MKKTVLLASLAAVAALAGGVAMAKGPQGGHFDRLDKDGDGKVSVAELDAREKAFVAKADANGDGYITKDEMKALHEERRAEMEARRFPDANGDSVVDAGEWNAAAQDRFAAMDKNKDGVISKDEMEMKGGRRHHH